MVKNFEGQKPFLPQKANFWSDSNGDNFSHGKKSFW